MIYNFILLSVAAEEEEWEALALGILHYVQQGGQGTTTVYDSDGISDG